MLQVVHEECGKVHECGLYQSGCPSAELATKGNGTSQAVLVSGLPGGSEYQVYMNYRVGNGGWSTCFWVDLTSYPDTAEVMPQIRFTPL